MRRRPLGQSILSSSKLSFAENLRICYRCAGAQQMSMSPLLHWITLALQELTDLSVSTERCFVVSTLIAGPSMVLCFVDNCLR
jgi:hypothetical protein